MFIIIPVLLAGLAGILRGGQLHNLGHLRLRGSWIPLVMFALQLVVVIFPMGRGAAWFRLGPWVTVATYALLMAFLMANRRLPGLRLVLLGAALNLAVILANGGYMPVTREALERSGHLDLIIDHGEKAYVLGSKDIVLSEAETHLKLLSDVVGIPETFPTSATFSLGDVFIMAGAAWLAYRALLGDPRREQEEDLRTCTLPARP